MLRTSPFHKENYSRLILTVVIQFYQRCSDRFQDLIATKDNVLPEAVQRVALAAEWAQKPDLHPCLSEMMRMPVRLSNITKQSVLKTRLQELNTPKKDRLYRQETHLELDFLEESGTVEKDHLIGSIRNLATLGSLYTSVVSQIRPYYLQLSDELLLSRSVGLPQL